MIAPQSMKSHSLPQGQAWWWSQSKQCLN